MQTKTIRRKSRCDPCPPAILSLYKHFIGEYTVSEEEEKGGGRFMETDPQSAEQLSVVKVNTCKFAVVSGFLGVGKTSLMIALTKY